MDYYKRQKLIKIIAEQLSLNELVEIKKLIDEKLFLEIKSENDEQKQEN